MNDSQVTFKVAVPQRTIRYDLLVRYEVSSARVWCCHCNNRSTSLDFARVE